ncbi:MAG: hypothetical protein ACSLE6_13315 [Mycobacterium sp.]
MCALGVQIFTVDDDIGDRHVATTTLGVDEHPVPSRRPFDPTGSDDVRADGVL